MRRSLIDTFMHWASDSREASLLKLWTLAASVLTLSFTLVYAAIDYRGLMPMIVWCIIAGLLWLLVFPLMNFGQTVSVSYFVAMAIATVGVTGLLVGSASGHHYHLLAAPAILLLAGVRRWRFSIALVAITFAAFLVIELYFPKASEISSMPAQYATLIKRVAVFNALAMVFGVICYMSLLTERAEAALAKEYSRSELLLQNLMPKSIASRLKERPDEIIADQFDSVTILFADLVDFTPRASRLKPAEIVAFLNQVFSEFDKLAEKHQLEKIKTIGDAYMVAGGMPDPRVGHASAVADMALEMLEVTRMLSRNAGEHIAVRIGIHTGAAVAGVIGTRKMFYDVWGDTVNTAARMESQGSAGRIQVTEDAVKILSDYYVFEPRGKVDVKGKGEMEVYYLVGRRDDHV